MDTADAYRILGLEQGASKKEIKAAYRRLAKEVHPDISKDDHQQFVLINEAYQRLTGKEAVEVVLPWQEAEAEQQWQAQQRGERWERWKKAEEERETMRLQMLQKVNKVLRPFVFCYLVFAGILAADFFLPLNVYDEEVVEVRWVYESVGAGRRGTMVYRYDDVFFREFRLRTSSKLVGRSTTYGKATVYASPILRSVRKAQVQEKGGEVVLLEPAYDFYTTFGWLIPLVLLLGGGYFLLPVRSEGRLTIGVILFFAAVMHLGLWFLS